MSYRELYRNLFDAHVVSPFYLKPLQPPYPKWYDANAQCDYHVGITGHSIENCTAFKKLVERLIGDGERGLIVSEGDHEQRRNYCEFHHEMGHEIQECAEFRTMVQCMMDNKEMEFCEGVQEESHPKNSEAGARVTQKVIIQKSAVFAYKDNKKVPWNYDCNVTISGKEDVISKMDQDEGSCTHSGKRYDQVKTRVEPTKDEVSTEKKGNMVEPKLLVNEPVREEEAREFLKFLKHSEYSVVEQLHKQLARISVLALLLSSEGHRNALLKVLNETYVADDIYVNKLDRLVSNISADNFIFFNDDEIPPGGMGSTRALHITTRCKGYILPGVLVDNGSALNVLPLSTLNRLPVDSSHMKSCQNVVRAFDGTEKRVIGRIGIPLLIGPIIYEVDFLVMDIRPLYSCLLERPWIHSAGAVPSSLHQKLKLVLEGRLMIINAEEDIIAMVANDTPFLETSEDAIEWKQDPEAQNIKDYKDGSTVDSGKRSFFEERIGEISLGSSRSPVLKNKHDHFGLGYKPDFKQMRMEREKKQMRRRARSLGGRSIHAVCEESSEGGTLWDIHPCEPGSVRNNWTAKEIPIVFRASSESLDINDTNVALTNSESPFERNMCLEGSQDFEDGEDGGLSPNLLKMTRQDLIRLLREFKNIFAWSYQDMPGLSTDIVVHPLLIREDCKPVQQKLRRMRPDILLKIKEEVQKQFDAGFLQEVKYSEWVANIVPVPKKDGKVRMCVDYWDLNKASPKDNFPLPHIDTLVDNTAGYSLFSFMDGFSGEIEVYVDDMIAKSRTEEEHVQVLRKLFLRLRKFQLKLNPAKCTFGARSGKLLGFVVSEKGIEIDLDKVKAIRDLPPPCTQKEVRECEEAFNKVKQSLSSTPVLSPPSPDRPLILHLAVFDNSMGCVLGHHDETGRKERAIYYLSKKFTDCEMRMARWQILLSEFDIVYVSQKAVKGSAIADFLASRALEDYEPLSFYFPNEDLLYVAITEENPQEGHSWKLNFDGASNAVGNGIGAVLVSPNGDHYPFTCKLDFDCTNNMAEYKACIMGIRTAIERRIKVLEVYGESALVIYQLKGEWETKDPKLVSYRKLVLELIKEFEDITFRYLPRDKNQMADALATLASMIKVNRQEDMKPIQMSIYENPAHCYNIEEGEIDDNPWYQDILRYVKKS
ncbi:uncharacterized protein LOC105767082 [Gossypium raimondii]|uniref:uncharacterized protein LOC105767082 n=1 Tax=Gossypium raimondii TaxID=29730 RepID=UPI00063ABF44|nr:uncharacterized protein LOC105767082 [Gossypium raimondii]